MDQILVEQILVEQILVEQILVEKIVSPPARVGGPPFRRQMSVEPAVAVALAPPIALYGPPVGQPSSTGARPASMAPRSCQTPALPLSCA